MIRVLRRIFNSRFPLAPADYIKHPAIVPDAKNAHCRGELRAAARRFAMLADSRWGEANRLSRPHRERKAWSLTIAWLGRCISDAAHRKALLGDRRG